MPGGTLHNGFARVMCKDCGYEYLLAFSVCLARNALDIMPVIDHMNFISGFSVSSLMGEI
jgi:hypothetical protein